MLTCQALLSDVIILKIGLKQRGAEEPVMSVKINIPSYMQVFTDNLPVVEVMGSTVGDCLNHLVKQFPAMKKVLFDQNGNLLSEFSIYVNSEDAYPHQLAKAVKDGDELHIPSLIAGG